jgi:aspartyl-tRNA(Asn)/glutamyl-tRNA(Gln) amidotransferase subunit C
MTVDPETLQKIAHLARIDLRPDEETELLVSLNSVLTWMAQLNELDTTGVEPLVHLSIEENVLRDDVMAHQLPRERALQNAPQHDEQFFQVPKVLG